MTRSLIAQYQQMAASGDVFRGLSILQHEAQITEIVRKYGVRSSEHGTKKLLDYGCGAGDAWKPPHRLHRKLGLRWFEVYTYDPAFPENAQEPHGLYDGVLCSDVLEHIPEHELDETVKRLFSHARKFVWASVCCRPANKTFPDGTNLHVTLRPMQWWHELFERHQPERGVDFILVGTP